MKFVVAILLTVLSTSAAWAEPDLEAADSTFWQQIQTVSEGFKDYARKNGYFPAFNMYGGEMVPTLRRALNDNLANPYYKERGELVKQIRLEERMAPDIDFRYMTDKTLDDERIDSYRSNPPSDWQGIPGTIVAVGNNAGDLMAFFGIGANGRPLADAEGDGVRVKFAVVRLEK